MNHQVLDVRGIQGRAARIRDIRAMAGRAMLDGPHDYQADSLEGPLLDLAVSKAVGLKAVIHLVDNALAPFYECCVLNESGRLQYQYIPSRMWGQGGPLVEDHSIELIPTYETNNLAEPCGQWAATLHGSELFCTIGPAPLVAAMRALVKAKLGATISM